MLLQTFADPLAWTSDDKCFYISILYNWAGLQWLIQVLKKQQLCVFVKLHPQPSVYTPLCSVGRLSTAPFPHLFELHRVLSIMKILKTAPGAEVHILTLLQEVSRLNLRLRELVRSQHTRGTDG